MSDEKLVNIARLMTTFRFEIDELSDTLRCAQCKLVLKDACQVPCGCRLCRACIDRMMARGDEFCPGVSDDCGDSLLSLFSLDYRANKRVSRLIAKCPRNGCVHECRLANVEEHLPECTMKSDECPRREWGCSEQLHQEKCNHNEILIGMVANINREIGSLKQSHEASIRQIELLKRELVLNDCRVREMFDRSIHVDNENKSMARERADLVNQVKLLSERIDREITERRESDELDSRGRVIEHVDREIAPIRSVVQSNEDNIQSINQRVESINKDICYLTSQLQSIQALLQIDARCDWLIDEDIRRARWECGGRLSDYFIGVACPYKYRLASCNGTDYDSLVIYLRIYRGECDSKQLPWPFKGRVVITVADRYRRKVCQSIPLQCRIKRPPVDDWRWSDRFEFTHSKLGRAGLKLGHGVYVSCVIVPGAGFK